MTDVILNGDLPLRAVCECSDRTISKFEGTEGEPRGYLFDWRLKHRSHGHSVQVFRTAEVGPRTRYGCTCGSVFSAPSGMCGHAFFKWTKAHRKHGGMVGEVC